MCGLAAIFAYAAAAPPVDEAELVTIRDSMRARGPDGAGLWMSGDGRVGLAHRRLAIIDLSDNAVQPMEFADGRCRITFNGEIYNFRELRRELEADGHTFATESDTEVILHLYHRHGAAGFSRLRGMYALALWDEARRGLLLARDPFGIKPLYVADDGATVRVASQVKALLAGGRVARTPDAAGHVGFFLFGHVPEPHTLFKGIQALPAGSTLWIGADGSRHRETFFDIPTALSQGDTGADLAEALADSVRHHLVADVPVGVFLSSGLDSATLVGLASEAHGTALDTMTLGFHEFEGTANDEVPLAEAVAAAHGTRHRTRWVSGGDFHESVPDLLAAMDQPSIDGINTYFVAREAAGLGLKVVLSGLGGDELFGGYDGFRQIPALVRNLGWAPSFLGKGFRRVSAPLIRRLTSPKYAGVLEYGTTFGDAYLLRRGLFMPWELPDVLDPELVRDGWPALAPRLRLAASADAVTGEREKVMALEMAWYMRNQLLRDADWAGMAHSLEIRVPLVDATLFRRVARLGASKRDMAAAPRTPLPDAVLNRPKTGFSVPVHDWVGGRGMRGWAKKVYEAALTG
jgi:asparagine synthase (glutamine-hydrolysing)